MPNIVKHYYRTWCKACQDWTIHQYLPEVKPLEKVPEGMERTLNCCVCGTEFKEVSHKDIPIEKLEEQRKRYKAEKHKEFEKMFQILDPGYQRAQEIMTMFGEPGCMNETKIHESDAGQKKIDERKKQEREAAQRELDALYLEREKYSSLGRNDVCLCGSGEKYKKCCMKKFIGLRR